MATAVDCVMATAVDCVMATEIDCVMATEIDCIVETEIAEATSIVDSDFFNLGYLPNTSTLSDAINLSIKTSKPVSMVFWTETARIGIYNNNEKILFNNEDYYTSKILRIIRTKSNKEYIVETEYSIFIVNSAIKGFRILQ